ncbi:MAG: hypothetical protein KAI71_04460 [Candidatus Pacebacteria bacterium]|nr:hypothetical protein [Candidatus Paceibacterota bacterium]
MIRKAATEEEEAIEEEAAAEEEEEDSGLYDTGYGGYGNFSACVNEIDPAADGCGSYEEIEPIDMALDCEDPVCPEGQDF